MFFRKVPDNGGFAIMAGVEQLVEYLKNLRFEKDDIDYLKIKNEVEALTKRLGITNDSSIPITFP